MFRDSQLLKWLRASVTKRSIGQPPAHKRKVLSINQVIFKWLIFAIEMCHILQTTHMFRLPFFCCIPLWIENTRFRIKKENLSDGFSLHCSEYSRRSFHVVTMPTTNSTSTTGTAMAARWPPLLLSTLAYRGGSISSPFHALHIITYLVIIKWHEQM